MTDHNWISPHSTEHHSTGHHSTNQYSVQPPTAGGYFIDPSAFVTDQPTDSPPADGSFIPAAWAPARTALPPRGALPTPWFALLDGVLAMLAALLAGFVVALILLNSSTDGRGDLLRYLPFALAVAAVRAPVRVDFALASDSSTAGAAHVTAQIGLVFTTFVVAVIALTARADRRRPPSSWRAVATSAVARALGAAALGVVLALVGSTTIGSGSILGSGDLTITPSAVGAFFGAFGFALAVSGLTSALIQRRRLLSPDRVRAVDLWVDAARDVRAFALMGGGLAAVVGVLYLARQGLLDSSWPAVVVELPTAAFGVLLLFAGAGAYAGVTSSYSYGGEHDGIGLFAGGSGALFTAALLVPLIAVLMAGTRATLRRPARAFAWAHAVRTAVVTVVGAGVVVWTMSATVSGSGDSGAVTLSGSGSEHVGFGVFGAVVAAAVWGLLLGVLGDPAARLCLRRAPGLARVLAGSRIHPSWAGMAASPVYAAPNQYGAPPAPTYPTDYPVPSAPPFADPYFGSSSPDPGPSAWSQWAAPSDAHVPTAVDAPDDPFWFAVTRSTDVLEPGGGSRVAFTLAPGQWYLAMGSAGPGRGGLHVILDSGLAGILYDVAEIHRAP